MKIFTKKQHKKDVREMNGEEIMKPIWELLYLDRWGKGKDNDELIKVIEKTLAIKEEQKDELLDFLENETKIKEVLIRQLQEQLKQRTDEILKLIEKWADNLHLHKFNNDELQELCQEILALEVEK